MKTITFSKYSETHKLFKYHGFRRSGNNAISQWLMSMVDQPYWITNNNSANLPLKMTKYNLVGEPPKSLTHKDKYVFKYGLMAYEDLELTKFTKLDLRHMSKDITHIYTLRDPYNMVASRLELQNTANSKGRGITPGAFPTLKTRLGWWCEYAEDYLRCNSYSIGILYNSWVRSEEYRRSISYILGLTYQDHTINTVTSEAGGSSFDRLNYQDKAGEMQTSERWMKFKDNPDYINLFTPRVSRLADLIFNMKPF